MIVLTKGLDSSSGHSVSYLGRAKAVQCYIIGLVSTWSDACVVQPEEGRSVRTGVVSCQQVLHVTRWQVLHTTWKETVATNDNWCCIPPGDMFKGMVGRKRCTGYLSPSPHCDYSGHVIVPVNCDYHGRRAPLVPLLQVSVWQGLLCMCVIIASTYMTTVYLLVTSVQTWMLSTSTVA